ncbi:hypothetical protein TNCV_4196471 [Trichonephila clavipes]|nr:hypothetical protein TNCV_4196471 [Trichonephila clavipes]
MCDQATEAGGLVPHSNSLTKLASLRRLFLAQQPLAMELPLASPASCELRSVIRFLAAKKKSAKEIHEELLSSVWRRVYELWDGAQMGQGL